MAKNMRLPKALHITVPVPEYVKSGDAVAVGAFRGVAQIDRDEQGESTIWMDGSADLVVDGVVAAVGDPVYIDPATGELASEEPTEGTGTLFGFALATKADTAATIEVALLNGPAQV